MLDDDDLSQEFVTYYCRNCLSTSKLFALVARARREEQATAIEFLKLGEYPEFGPSTPARLISMIGPAKDLFLKGRRCETRGFGIGAFAYYRRVVESQKNQIIESIAKAAERINAPPEMIVTLRKAKSETRFAAAIALIKDAIPEGIKIRGHNPLTLLHSALSDGVHERTDEECLDRAQIIRTVLAELSERIAQALKDDQELTDALTKLMQVPARQNEAK